MAGDTFSSSLVSGPQLMSMSMYRTYLLCMFFFLSN